MHRDHPQAERIRKVFRHLEIQPEWEADFYALWVEKRFDKRDFILQAGETERFFYVVAEGVQSIYVLNHQADKVVLGFSYPGDPSGGYESFLYQRPSEYFLEALTPSRLYGITLPQYEALFDWSPAFERWARLFHQEVLVGRISREVELLTRSAEDRYVAFMRRCPEELLQIPQKYLASYLNMTPETFSRLRSRVKY
jgi:CRP-like cAMP-binding protein